MTVKWKPVIMGLFLVVLVGALLSGPLMSNVEHPEYAVIEKYKTIELRDYAPRIIAQVSVSGPREDSISTGFRQLADYIFGNNSPKAAVLERETISQNGKTSKNQKIEMTAPVEQSLIDDTWVINFTMPSEYALETLPNPNNVAVKLSEIPSQSFIAIQFSGMNSASNINKYEKKLRAFTAENNIRIQKNPIYAFYNPPWTLPMLRRNEVMFRIDNN